MTRSRTYADDWDAYVDNWRSHVEREPDTGRERNVVYPGDEWGNQKEWSEVTNERLIPCLPADGSGIAVEIGSGSGKYAEAIFDHVSKIVCFDVSPKFMEIAAQRLEQTKGLSDKVRFELLGLESCFEVRDRAVELGIAENVDLVFSIDSMQHVEMHTLFGYLVNAGLILKPDGYLVLSVASCATTKGLNRLIGDAGWVYGNQRPAHHFYFLSTEAIRFPLEGLGFEIVTVTEDRDVMVVARKRSESEALLRRAEQIMRPEWLEAIKFESDRAGLEAAVAEREAAAAEAKAEEAERAAALARDAAAQAEAVAAQAEAVAAQAEAVAAQARATASLALTAAIAKGKVRNAASRRAKAAIGEPVDEETSAEEQVHAAPAE